jgi:hypothetical protein
MKASSNSQPRGNGALVPALLFLLTGLFALATFGVLVWLHPEWILEASSRPETWAVFALLTLGWLGSMIFGLAYHVVPMLAGLPWWSRRLPWLHWGLHVVGLLWIGAFVVGWLPYGLAPGGIAVVAGIALFVLNQQITTGRLSLWEPANITCTPALFWLIVTAGLWAALQTGQAGRFTRVEPEVLAQLILHLGLVGVVVMGLLGAALKLIPMFLVSAARPGFLSWLGAITLSLGLYASAVAHLGALPALLPKANLGIAAGTTFYLLDIVRLAWGGRRAWGWDLALAGFGLVLLLAWLGWNLSGRSWGGLEVGSPWVSLVMGLLGPCTWVVLGLAARLVPLLGWTWVYAPQVGSAPVPSVATLSRGAVWVPLAVVLLLASGYLTAGLVLVEKTGLVFAAASYVVAVALFLVGITPTLRAIAFGRRRATGPVQPVPAPVVH